MRYQGAITSNTAYNGGVVCPLILVTNTTGGSVELARGSAPAGSTVANAISDTGGNGIRVIDNAKASTIVIDNVSLINNNSTAILVQDDASTTTISAGTGAGIVKQTAGAAIAVEGISTLSPLFGPVFTYTGAITNSNPVDGSPSYLLSVADTTNADITIGSSGDVLVDTASGIQLTGNTDTSIWVQNAQIASVGPQGLYAANNSGSSSLFKFINLNITAATNAGIYLDQNTQPMQFSNLNINLQSTGAIGFQARDSTGIVTVDQTSNIATASVTQPAVLIDKSAIDMNFFTITSGVTSGGAVKALQFLDPTSSGTFTVDQAFTVGGARGTVLDVLDTTAGSVTITLPPP